MNFLSMFKTKLATTLLALALCTTSAAAMGSGSCSCASSGSANSNNTECKASTDDKKICVYQEPLVRKNNELYNLLYNTLTTLPRELIDIIVAYDHHMLKGKCAHAISGDRLTGLTILSNQHMVTAHDYSKDIKNLRTWDIQTGQNITIYNDSGHFQCLTPVAENKIATIFNGNLIVVLDLATEKDAEQKTARMVGILRDDETSGTAIVSLQRLVNGQLVSGDRNHRIKIWDPMARKTKQCLHTITTSVVGCSGDVRCLRQCTNGLLVSGASHPGDIKAWNLANNGPQCTQTFAPSKRIKGCKGCSVNCLTVLSNDWIAAGTDAGTIVIWDPITNNGKVIDSATFTDNKKPTPYYSITILSNGYLAAGTLYGTIHIIDPLTGTLVATLVHNKNSKKGEHPVNFLCTAPNGWLVSGSMDGVIKIWN